MTSFETKAREVLGTTSAERVVATACMWPFLPAGSMVRVRRLRRAPRVGEVWVAVSGARHVVHRVLWVRHSGAALLKGDRGTVVDGWIPPHDLFGPVEAVRRGATANAPWRPVNRLRDRVAGLTLSAAWFAYLHARAAAGRAARRILRRASV